MSERDLNEIAKSLPHGWTMWQAPCGICLQIQQDGVRENLQGTDMADVLRKADGYKILPRLNPRPDVFIAADWKPEKVNGKWRPRRHDGREMECYTKTKRECQEAIERFERLSLDQRSEWDRKFDEMFPDGAVEGVDFRWA